MAQVNSTTPSQSTTNKLHSEISKVDQSLEAIKNVQQEIKNNPDAFTYYNRTKKWGAAEIDKLITNGATENNAFFGKTKEWAQDTIQKQSSTMSAIGKLYSQNLLKFAGARVTGDELDRMDRWNPSPQSSAAENQAKAQVEVDSMNSQISTYRKHLLSIGRDKALITGNDEHDMETISALQDRVDTDLTALEGSDNSRNPRKLQKVYDESNAKLEAYVSKFNKHYADKEDVPALAPTSPGQGISQQNSQFTGEVTGDLQRQEARLQQQDKALDAKQGFTTEELMAEKRRRSGE